MVAYYNEIDPDAAQALRNLIDMGLIAPGDVDERDIRDVKPRDLTGYSQCHFFAGIGIWSLALRNAGVPDTVQIWTGSCPCQPFSAAGGRGGLADERHLWPHWHYLIEQCGPEIVLGEQVASKDGLGWFDLVSADMEGTGYAIAAEDRCGPSVGAPHIRQRLWFGAMRLADTVRIGQPGSRVMGRSGNSKTETNREIGGTVDVGGGCGMADAYGRNTGAERQQPGGEQRQQSQDRGIGGMADAALEQCDRSGDRRSSGWNEHSDSSATQWMGDTERNVSGRMPGETSGAQAESRCVEEPCDNGPVDASACAHGTGTHDNPWRDADWLYCRDEKWRPVEPGTFPLVDGLPRSVGKSDPRLARMAEMAGLDSASLRRAKRHRVIALKCYGNAIIEPVARQFVEDFMDAIQQGQPV